MVREKYGVRLEPEQRDRLEHLVRAGKSSARVTTRARILLKTDDVGPRPRWRRPWMWSRARCTGSSGALPRLGWKGCCGTGPRPSVPEAGRPGRSPSDCPGLQPAPEGHDHWTPAPIGGQGGGVGVGARPVLRNGAPAAQKNVLKPWQKREWCIPKVSADFVAHMEDVLDLYAEPYDPQRPVVCFDETSTSCWATSGPPIPAAPGQPRRQDYEYRREGTRNLFLACEPLAGCGTWR